MKFLRSYIDNVKPNFIGEGKYSKWFPLFDAIENLFFTIIYSLIGSLFFSFYYVETFNLYINGNGGFIGNYLNQTFLSALISSFEKISYFF